MAPFTAGKVDCPAIAVARTPVLERVRRVLPRFLSIVAPAGYGKTTLARQIVASSEVNAVIDCSSVTSSAKFSRIIVENVAKLARRGGALAEAQLAQGPASEEGDEWAAFALEAWRLPTAPSAVVLDNADSLWTNCINIELVNTILATTPEDRCIVTCSRQPLPLHLTRFAPAERIMTLRATDLAFDEAETSIILSGAGFSEAETARSFAVTRGWPIAVLLLVRLAREGRLSTTLDRIEAVAFDDLYEYLSAEVIANLEPAAMKLILALAAIPDATTTDLEAISPGNSLVEHREGIMKLPFVQLDHDSIIVHPLVKATLAQAFPSEMRELLVTAAGFHLSNGRCTRASQLFLAAGQTEDAAAALARMPPYLFTTALPECAQIISQLSSDLICRYPALWSAAVPFRGFAHGDDTQLREGRQVWHSLHADVSPDVSVAVLMNYTSALHQHGHFNECREMLEREIAKFPEPSFHRSMLCFHLAARLGVQGYFTKAKRLCAATAYFDGLEFVRGRTLDFVEAHSFLTSGKYSEGMAVLEQAIRLARASGATVTTASSLSNAAFFAWLYGDDDRFNSLIADLEEILVPGLRLGFASFVAYARGCGFESESRSAIRVFHACALLFVCANADDLEVARAAARQAVSQANAAGDPFLQVLTNIAVAELIVDQRADAIQAAAAAAKLIDSRPLRRALASYTSGGSDLGLLGTFVTRRVRRVQAEPSARFVVHILSGQVLIGTNPAPLSDRELELIMLLSLRRSPVTRESIADAMWPDLDGDAAMNNLKGCAYRVRKKLGEKFIVTSTRGYGLHLSTQVDLGEIENQAALLQRSTLKANERAKLLGTLRALTAGRPAKMLRWHWFQSHERRLLELTRSIVMRLADDAVARSRFGEAIGMVTNYFEADPLDETATRILISSYRGRGEEGLATQAFVRHKAALNAGLGVQPTTSIRTLMAAV